MIDDKEFDTVAQLSHFGWGLAVVFGADALVQSTLAVWIAAGVWIFYSAGKEFIYDEKFETPEVRGNSTKDFLFQAGGALAALLLLILFRRIP